MWIYVHIHIARVCVCVCAWICVSSVWSVCYCMWICICMCDMHITCVQVRTCACTMAYPPACTDQDRLFYVVYEKLSVEGKGMEPHLWTYRSKVSLEHLSHQQDMQKKCPILQKFIKEVRLHEQHAFLSLYRVLPTVIPSVYTLYVCAHQHNCCTVVLEVSGSLRGRSEAKPKLGTYVVQQQ